MQLRKRLGLIMNDNLAEIIAKKTAEIESIIRAPFPYRCRPCIEGDKPVRSSVSDKWVHPSWQAGRVVCGYSDLLNEPETNESAQLAIVCLGIKIAGRGAV